MSSLNSVSEPKPVGAEGFWLETEFFVGSINSVVRWFRNYRGLEITGN